MPVKRLDQERNAALRTVHELGQPDLQCSYCGLIGFFNLLRSQVGFKVYFFLRWSGVWLAQLQEKADRNSTRSLGC